MITNSSTYKNEEKIQAALQNIKSLAEKGHGDANFVLGDILRYNLFSSSVRLNVQPSYTESTLAERYYKTGAAAGDSRSLYELADCHLAGYGGTKICVAIADKLYEESMFHGLKETYAKLGDLYLNKFYQAAPISPKIELAMQCYIYGAFMRCPRCALQLATAYMDGIDKKIVPSSRQASLYFLSNQARIDHSDDESDNGQVDAYDVCYSSDFKTSF